MSSKAAYPVLLVVLVAVGAGAGALVASLRVTRPAGATGTATATADSAGVTSENPYARFAVADFELTDQDGKPADQTIFDGRVTVLTFFYTSCPDPCPFITRAMADVQERTKGTKVRFASVSVDGEHDTPERIRAYGTGYGADFARWVWLTGDPAVVGSVVSDSISFKVHDSADLTVMRSDGTKMAQILHPTRLILVGPDRHVLGLYAYNDPDAIEQLVKDATAAAG